MGGPQPSANDQTGRSEPCQNNGEQQQTEAAAGWARDATVFEQKAIVAEHDSRGAAIAAASALLLTLDEVAGLLRLDARSVAALARSGALQTIEVGGTVRVARSSVDQLVIALLRGDFPQDGPVNI